MIASIVILALVTAERLVELVVSRRNEARLLARGGREFGASHYPAMVALHAAWLISLWGFGWDNAVNWWLAAFYALLQLFRAWIMLSLGAYWNTRVIVVPGEPLVARGPYKFINHPNYVLVAFEVACLPLVFGLWLHAFLFTALNAAMMWWRIGVENEALKRLGGRQA